MSTRPLHCVAVSEYRIGAATALQLVRFQPPTSASCFCFFAFSSNSCIIILLPLVATCLLFLGCYLPISKDNEYSIQDGKIVTNTTLYSIHDDIFDGTSTRNVALTAQIFSVIIPILVYTLHLSPWKFCTRSTILALLSIAQFPLLLSLAGYDLNKCGSRKCQAYGHAEDCLIAASMLTPVSALVASALLRGLMDPMIKARATAAQEQQAAGAPASKTTVKSDWEKSCERAKKDVLEDATRAIDNGDPFSLVNLTSASFKSTDATTSVLDVESQTVSVFLGADTRTVSEGIMQFHKGLTDSPLRLISGYGNNRHGSFVFLEGMVSVWTGKAYWVSQAPSSNIQTLVTGTFTRSLNHHSGAIPFVGSFKCDNNVAGDFGSFTVQAKDEEPNELSSISTASLFRGSLDVDETIIKQSDNAESHGIESGTNTESEIVCIVRPVDLDLPATASLPVAQAKILPEEATLEL